MRARTLLLALLAAGAALAAGHRIAAAGRRDPGTSAAGTRRATSGGPLSATQSLGPARSSGNLTLFPIRDTAARNRVRYVTLDEAFRSKTVAIREKQGGGEVNELLVTNHGRDPLYLMAGEVLLGGQQDRLLGENTLVPPGKKDLPVAVFCVEHGRWNGAVAFGSSAKALADQGIRLTAQDAAFYAKVGRGQAGGTPAQTADANPAVARDQGIAGAVRIGSRATQEEAAGQTPQAGRQQVARQAAAPPGSAASGGAAASRPSPPSVGEAQQRVWEKVAEKNRRMKANPASGTYRAVVNQEAGTAAKAIEPYVRALVRAFDRDPQTVGVVAAINGEVIAADLFGQPDLFRRLYPKLLRGYAAQAATEPAPDSRPGTAGRAARKPTPADALAFLAQGRAEGRVDRASVAGGLSLRRETEKAVGYELRPAAGGMGGAAGAPSLHRSLIKK